MNGCQNTIKMVDMESIDMCDVKKYYNIYDELKKLKPEDTLQLVMEAENDEEKQFFEMLGNYLLQEKQNKVKRNIF